MTSTTPLVDQNRTGEKKLCFRYDPFCRPLFGDLLCDLRASDGDLSIGDGGRFHMDSSSEWSRCPYLLWTWRGSFCAMPCICNSLWFWTLSFWTCWWFRIWSRSCSWWRCSLRRICNYLRCSYIFFCFLSSQPWWFVCFVKLGDVCLGFHRGKKGVWSRCRMAFEHTNHSP